MFEPARATSTQTLEELLPMLARIDADVSDAERIDQLAMLERVKSAVAAAQARITVEFVESQEQVARERRQRAKECADDNDFAGWREAREQARRAGRDGQGRAHDAAAADGGRRRRGRRPGGDLGADGQVALARRVSPSRGSRLVATALTLVREMPFTMAALEDGTLTEWRAELVTREAAILSSEHRRLVDAELAETLGDRLGRLGDQELCRQVRAIAYRVDPESVLKRCRGAEGDRRVSVRPAPDAMAYLTAFLPVAQAVAAHAALTRTAATARAEGDPRAKGQVMADALVTRVTGQADAAAVPVEIQLVLTDRTLLAGDSTPAHIPGYGPVPAGWPGTWWPERSRTAVRTAPGPPRCGCGVSTPIPRPACWSGWTRRRVFDGGLRRFLVTRDGICRTPWCDAPVRHVDHVVAHAAGGATSAGNGQGYCVRCNLTKEHPGWRTEVVHPHVVGQATHTVVTTTPTGHRYRSTAPPVVAGLRPPDPDESLLERHYALVVAA